MLLFGILLLPLSDGFGGANDCGARRDGCQQAQDHIVFLLDDLLFGLNNTFSYRSKIHLLNMRCMEVKTINMTLACDVPNKWVMRTTTRHGVTPLLVGPFAQPELAVKVTQTKTVFPHPNQACETGRQPLDDD